MGSEKQHQILPDAEPRQSKGEVSLNESLDPKDVLAKGNTVEDTFPEGGARAWSVAAGTAGVTFCTLGYLNSYGVFQGYYQIHQLSHLSPSTIAWIGSIQAFFLFAGGLFGGPLFDRFGAKVIRPAALVYICSIMMTSLCQEYYQFMLIQGVLGGISSGMVMCPTMAAAPQYFDKKRAAAMGLGIAGSSLGGVLMPIAMSKMLVHTDLGFGWTVRILGFVITVLLLPSSIAIKARLPPRKKKFFLPSAFQEPPYVNLIAAGFFGFLGLFTPLFYLPVYAIEQGMSPGLAFYLAAIFNGASFPSRVIPGILADKLGRFNIFIAATVSSGILTFCWPKVKSNAAILVFAVIFGFCSGAIVSGMAVSFASIPQDPKNIGTYMGMGMAISATAALIGPPINGALFSDYYGFNQLSAFSGIMCLVAAFFIVVAKYYTEKGLFSKS